MKGLGKFDSQYKGVLSAPQSAAQKIEEAQLVSEESSIAAFESIFDNFVLEVYPFYNYWTQDERKNGSEERGGRNLDELPRFIKVTWNRAPDMPRPLSQQLTLPSVGIRTQQKNKGGQANKGFSFLSKGITFSPEHLSPKGFPLIRQSLANGHIGPGTVETVIEMPLHNTGLDSHKTHAKTSHIHHIDEDAFLTHADMRGISLHELKANVTQLTNGIVNSARVAKASKNAGTLFRGKFSIGKSPFAGGNIQLDGVHPSSPALSMVARTAVSAQGEASDHVVDNVRKVMESSAGAAVKRSIQNKVKFVYPVLGGAISQKKVNMIHRPEHAESTVAIAQMLPQLQALSDSGIREQKKKIEIPSFPSPPGLRPVEYIGYILEKYRRNASGVFERVTEIEITDKDQNDYIDTKVVYGEIYRYRIKALLRWTRPNNIGPLGPEPLQVTQNGSQTKSTAPFKSSYFAGEWSRNWAYGTVIDTTPPPPPDELVVRPESSRKRVHVTFKLPHNPQKDINSMVLLRKVQSSSGQDLTEWEVLTEYGSKNSGMELAPQNVLYIDDDVNFFQKSRVRYLYSAQTHTRHGEVSGLSDQLATRLNSEWRVQGEMPVDFVSCAGVKPEHFGAFSTIPLRRMASELIAVPKRDGARLNSDAVFSGRNGQSNAILDQKDYVVRIESLDTGEVRDIDVSVTFKNLPTLAKSIVTDVIVPSHNQSQKNSSEFGKTEVQKAAANSNNNRKNIPHKPGKSVLHRPTPVRKR